MFKEKRLDKKQQKKSAENWDVVVLYAGIYGLCPHPYTHTPGPYSPCWAVKICFSVLYVRH